MQETEKKKILIIEDEKPLAHALLLKLSHEGFDVITTESGQKGLDYLDAEHFDLVLTDLIIPGVDGFKVLETMREKGLTIPVIVITSDCTVSALQAHAPIPISEKMVFRV